MKKVSGCLFAGLVLLESLAACGSSATTMKTIAAQPREVATTTAGAETLVLSSELMTSPSELRARMAHPLVRPPLARLAPGAGSWLFAPHPSSLASPAGLALLTRTESRPAFRDGSGEPREYVGSVTSDPVGPHLITTIAQVDDARLRYAP